MVQQEFLPIKFERTDDEVTARSGLVLFDEFIKAFGLKRVLARHMPLPGSNRGFESWRYIEPLVLMLYGGGRHIEDLRELREDRALLGAAQMGQIPSSSAFGDWFVRMGEGMETHATPGEADLGAAPSLDRAGSRLLGALEPDHLRSAGPPLFPG